MKKIESLNKSFDFPSDMNSANIITLTRFILTPVIAVLILYNKLVPAAVIFFIAGSSDLLDGIVARTKKQASEFGQRFEAIADIVLYYAVIVALAASGNLPQWVILVAGILAFFIGVIIYAISKTEKRLYIPHRTSIKVAAVVLFFTTFLYILNFEYKMWLVYLTFLVGIWPIIDYILIISSKYKIEEKSVIEKFFKKKH
ncbi:CDP-alcohol phosphatidyltransferase family protein [Nanoarchaeota archaeon]